MDIRKLQRAIVDGLEDVKAQHIAVFNTEAQSPLFERVIIATGASNRQTKSLAASVRDKVRERGLPVMRTEGEDNGEWIIVDCGAAVVHIMQPAIREYYRLEEIWGDKPVRMKLGTNGRSGLVKAAEPMDAPDAGEPARPPRRAGVDAKAQPGAKRPATPRAAPASRRPSTPRQPAAQGAVRSAAAGAAPRKTAVKPVGKTVGKAVGKSALGKTLAKTAGKTASKTASKTAGKTAGKTARKTTSASATRKAPAATRRRA